MIWHWFKKIVIWLMHNWCKFTIIKPKGIIIEYNSAGIIITETEILNSEINGKRKEYYDTGNLKSESNYINGVKNGKTKTFYENSNLKEDIDYILSVFKNSNNNEIKDLIIKTDVLADKIDALPTLGDITTIQPDPALFKNIRKDNLSLHIYSQKKNKDKLKDNQVKDELQNENIFNKLYIKSIGKEWETPSKALPTRDFSKFEIKEILKRYQLNMEKISSGFSNEYIDLLTEFLYSKKKGYSKERLKLSDYRVYLTRHNKKSQVNYIEGFNNYINKSYNNKYNNKLAIYEYLTPNRNKFKKNKKFLNSLYSNKNKLRDRNSPNNKNFYNSRIMTHCENRKNNYKINTFNMINEFINTRNIIQIYIKI